MSSDYRPRGGSSSGSTGSGSGGGPRRRRGGRNRGGAGRSHSGEARSGEHRPHTNGTSSAPAKKESPIAKLFGWLTGKKKTESKPSSHTAKPSSSRSDFREDKPREPRAPRADRPARPDKPKEDPTPQEIVSPKLYVGNLAYEAVEHDLFDLFSKVGAVKNVEIAMDRHANRSKGFGFVEMETLETAKEASAKYNRTDFMGRQIVVSGAKLERRSVNKRDDEEPAAEERTGADETSD